MARKLEYREGILQATGGNDIRQKFAGVYFFLSPPEFGAPPAGELLTVFSTSPVLTLIF